MRFEWDPAKDPLNLRKHGVAFDEAVSAFRDDDGVEVFDLRHSTPQEQRWRLIARTRTGHLLVVIFTRRGTHEDEITRIISARPANRRERPFYPARHDDSGGGGTAH